MSETVQDLLGKRPAPSATLQLVQRWRNELYVIGAMVLVLAAPFMLRPSESTAPSRYDKRLVILTPHHEQIRHEFGKGFARYWKRETGKTLYLDWRVAGTAEINMLVKSDFSSAFQRYWKVDKGQPWTEAVAGGFMKSKDTSEARQAFLASNVGIGVDLFFGGGPYDFRLQADAGVLVSRDAKTGAGLARIQEKHPEWFSDSAIPEGINGQVYRDKDLRWCGTCLSSFGIVYNTDVLERLGIENKPTQWTDLADPRLRTHLVLADPTKSGSVTQTFEMIMQEEMHKAVARLTAAPGRLRGAAEIEAAGVRAGWISGLQLIQRIAANSRYFTDSSAKIPLEVAKGDAAVGMCIDFYGRSAEEYVRGADGSSRVGFIAPVGGTAISVDAIGLMRGAPEPELAAQFIEWVLSPEGQKIWAYRKGMPGGPESQALRRLPVRRDFYSAANKTFMSDGGEEPWEKAKAFVYRPEWTAQAFSSLRFIIRVMCVDTHQELKDAWRAITESAKPERATEILGQMTSVNYDTAIGDLASMLSSRDTIREVREARRLTEAFSRQYEKAELNAAAGGRK